MATNVTTSLNNEDWKRCKATGLKWNQLILLGYNSFVGKSSTHDEIEDLKNCNKQLMQSVSFLKKRVSFLEEPTMDQIKKKHYGTMLEGDKNDNQN